MNKNDFCVYIEGGSAPKVAHNSYTSAMAEAIRLAEKEKKQAYVLQCYDIVNPTKKSTHAATIEILEKALNEIKNITAEKY